MNLLRSMAAFLLVGALAPATLLARGGGGCLDEQTPVLTPSGPVPIERLRAGDTVLAPRGTGELVPARVEGLVVVEPAEFVAIDLGDRVVRATAEHPFEVAPGTFRMAGHLAAGQTVRAWDGRAVVDRPIRAVTREAATRHAYNLLVRGGVYIAAGVVVHNKGCFLPDTLILRADGRETSISAVRAGDEVLAFEPDGRIRAAAVRELLTHDVDEHFVVTTERTVLAVTGEHPFYVGDGTFKTLESLHVGDRVFAYDGSALAPQAILGMQRVPGRVTVYNLRTDWPHTYFAGRVAVHNKGGGGGGCFPAGVQIAGPAGARPIETLRVGDAVFAVDESGAVTTARVDALHRTDNALVEVQTDRGVLTTTAEHPLRLAAGGYRPAGDLAPGDAVLVMGRGDGSQQLEAATVQAVRVTGRRAAVYNLTVDGPHTFVADGFVVHNKGGGGGFRSSGSSGGFRSSSSGGFRSSGGGRCGAMNWLFCPFVIVIVFIGAIVNWVKTKFARQRHGGHYDALSGAGEELDFIFSPPQVVPRVIKTERLLHFLAQQDPSVAPDALKRRAEQVFLSLQKWWQERNYEPMRGMILPDLWADHAAQLKAMRRTHEINVIDGVKIHRMELVHVRYTRDIEQREFTALITAVARDYYVDDRTRNFLRGDRSAAQFQEFWTFQWHAGDWKLREIEQTRESDALKDENFAEGMGGESLAAADDALAAAGAAAGADEPFDIERKDTRVDALLRQLARGDKLWDRNRLKDRVRRVFLNTLLARQANDEGAVKGDDLWPEMAQALRADVRQRKAEGLVVEYRNLCVRKIEVVLVRNYKDNRRDEFTARVTAHAQQVAWRNGQVAGQEPYVTAFTEYWTFGRLDGEWKLREVLPPAAGDKHVTAPNVDEDAVGV